MEEMALELSLRGLVRCYREEKLFQKGREFGEQQRMQWPWSFPGAQQQEDADWL